MKGTIERMGRYHMVIDGKAVSYDDIHTLQIRGSTTDRILTFLLAFAGFSLIYGGLIAL